MGQKYEKTRFFFSFHFFPYRFSDFPWASPQEQVLQIGRPTALTVTRQSEEANPDL
jgi:hypothetical protein